jgi:hypothetical protein
MNWYLLPVWYVVANIVAALISSLFEFRSLNYPGNHNFSKSAPKAYWPRYFYTFREEFKPVRFAVVSLIWIPVLTIQFIYEKVLAKL